MREKIRLPRLYRLRRTSVLAAGLLAFVAGVGFAKLGYRFSLWWLLFAGLLVAMSLRRLQPVAIIYFLALGFLLGWWRGGQVLGQLMPYQQAYGHKITMQATAGTDAIYADHSQLSFDASAIQLEQPVQAKVPGTITIKGFGESAVFRGDRLKISGKLQTTLGGKQGRMSFAEFSLMAHHDTVIDKVRRRFNSGLLSAEPEPLASFGLGLLIGQRNTLPPAITKQLSTVGLSHIVAVSGYNLTIIIDSVRRLLGGRSKYQGTMLSLLLIIGFLLVTGLSASIVRAAIVSTLGLWAWYYGRKFQPLLLLGLAATVTAAWNPLYVWGDIGWYLSFMAFFGVLVLCPLVVRRLYGPKRKPKELPLLLIECLCAQMMAAPIILYVFSQASLVALPSNALIVPLVPLGMLLTFIAGLGGMVASSVAGWLAWPGRILLTYMLDAIALLARIPHAAVSRSMPLYYMVALYALTVVLCIILWHKTRQKDGTITGIELETE